MQIPFQRQLTKNLSKGLNQPFQRLIKSLLTFLKVIRRKKAFNNTIIGIELSMQEQLQKQHMTLS